MLAINFVVLATSMVGASWAREKAEVPVKVNNATSLRKSFAELTGYHYPSPSPSNLFFCRSTIKCESRSDPHITTFGRRTYPFRGEGEFVLVDWSSRLDGTTKSKINVCQKSFATKWGSYNMKAAFKCDDQIAFVDAENEGQVNIYKKTKTGITAFTGTKSAFHITANKDSGIIYIKCDTKPPRLASARTHGVGNTLRIEFKTATEGTSEAMKEKGGIPKTIKFLNIAIFLDINDAYGTVNKGLCQPYPSQTRFVSGTSTTGNPVSIKYPNYMQSRDKIHQERASFRFNQHGPNSWFQEDLISKIGAYMKMSNHPGYNEQTWCPKHLDSLSTTTKASCPQSELSNVQECYGMCAHFYRNNLPAIIECEADSLAKCIHCDPSKNAPSHFFSN
ncbi:hypothetical protein AAMO2058_000600200 [Amorphochlora amoebiformis]